MKNKDVLFTSILLVLTLSGCASAVSIPHHVNSINNIPLNRNLSSNSQNISVTNESGNVNLINGKLNDLTRVQIQTPTYDGSGQSVHPDVYYNISATFLGIYNHPYWMIMTPYPLGKSTYENPSLLCSDNGLNWSVPSNVSNPIDSTPKYGRHNNDVDMIYNTNDQKFYIYYLDSLSTPYDTIVRMRTFNGTTVSNEYTVLGISNQSLSPAFIFDNGIIYAYAVTWESANHRAANKLCMYTSTNSLNFKYVQNIRLLNMVSGKNIWHINVERYNNGLRWIGPECDIGKSGKNATIYYGKSSNYTAPITFMTTPLIPHRLGHWDSTLTYRACTLSNSTGMSVWYSATDAGKHWHIGYMRFDNNLTANSLVVQK